MSFADRIEKARSFEEALFGALHGMGFTVAKSGTEHTFPEFVAALRQSQDQTSLSIRFQPDAIAHIGRVPRSFYIEAKAAHTIEKAAWEQYWKLCNNDNVVVIVFEDLDWRWNFLEDIQLIDGNVTVSPFPIEKRFPVIDGWIVPRGSRRAAEMQNFAGAGTPYKEVDISSLLSWMEFKYRILERLERECIQ